MPPSRGDTFRKEVDIIAKEDGEQLITGVVMRPNAVDLQRDWATPEQIATFADDFGDLLENGSADGGVMHAAWPSEWLDLEFNGIAGRDDVPERVADEVESGDWVQTWRVNDDGLYELIQNDVISGFSIGARDVTWVPTDPEDLPEGVGIPPEIDADEGVFEITDGVVREVSVVDIPAVPDAQILAKALGDHLGNREAFMEEAMERGHSEDDAERLWQNLSRAMDEENAGTPGKSSFFERMGKAAASVLPGVEIPDDASVAETQTRTDSQKRMSTEKEWGADAYWVRAGEDPMDGQAPGDLLGVAVDMPEGDVYIDWRQETFPDPLKEPHVSIYGSIDDLMTATSNVIEPAGSIVSEEPAAIEDDEPDTEQSQSTTDMSNDDTNDDDVLAELKSLREDIDEMKSDADGGADDETDKDANADADADKDASEEILNELKELREDVDDIGERSKENAEAIDAIGKQSGYSTQATGDGETDKDGETDTMDTIKGALS